MTTHRLTLERPSPYRRRRFVASHRRRSPLLSLLKPFLSALLLVAAALSAVAWLVGSSRFLVSQVHVEGASRVAASQIVTALEPLQGRHLLGLSLAEVEGRLMSDPWIQKVAIRKELPDRLVVDIRERRPVALLRRDDEILYVDEGGFVIAPYDPSGPVDLLLVSAAPGIPLEVGAALQVVSELDRSVSLWSSGLSELEILGGGDFRIHTAALPFPVLVSAKGVARQVRKLQGLLPEILRRYEAVTAVDLRFSGQIVVQPALERRSQEG